MESTGRVGNPHFVDVAVSAIDVPAIEQTATDRPFARMPVASAGRTDRQPRIGTHDRRRRD